MQFNQPKKSCRVQRQLTKQINFDSFTAHVSFPPFICMRDGYFAAQHHVMKDTTENFFSTIMMIVLNWFLPLAPSRSTIGHLLKKTNQPGSASTSERLRSNHFFYQASVKCIAIVRSLGISKVVISYIRRAWISTTAGTRGKVNQASAGLFFRNCCQLGWINLLQVAGLLYASSLVG